MAIKPHIFTEKSQPAKARQSSLPFSVPCPLFSDSLIPAGDLEQFAETDCGQKVIVLGGDRFLRGGKAEGGVGCFPDRNGLGGASVAAAYQYEAYVGESRGVCTLARASQKPRRSRMSSSLISFFNSVRTPKSAFAPALR